MSEHEKQQPVMYIFVNDDLEMSKGQLVAQCCHMAHLITDERVTAMYEEHPPSADTLIYTRWRGNCVKIVKRASESQLQELSKLSYARQFVDEAKRIPRGSTTVVGFLPRSPSDVRADIDVHRFKLL
jgi:peptidyl-tRNA hydrolase